MFSQPVQANSMAQSLFKKILHSGWRLCAVCYYLKHSTKQHKPTTFCGAKICEEGIKVHHCWPSSATTFTCLVVIVIYRSRLNPAHIIHLCKYQIVEWVGDVVQRRGRQRCVWLMNLYIFLVMKTSGGKLVVKFEWSARNRKKENLFLFCLEWIRKNYKKKNIK